MSTTQKEKLKKIFVVVVVVQTTMVMEVDRDHIEHKNIFSMTFFTYIFFSEFKLLLNNNVKNITWKMFRRSI